MVRIVLETLVFMLVFNRPFPFVIGVTYITLILVSYVAYNILHVQLRLTTYGICIGVMFCMRVPLNIALIHF
jgi:hypothetical protein